VIGGGRDNRIPSNSEYATIPGGFLNTATNYAFAAGRHAKANHVGSFVWADFPSARDNEFTLRAAAGVRIQSGRGVALNGADTPLITRGWDAFTSNAPVAKQGHGRWGLFMEPHALTAGIPTVSGKIFQVARYETNGTLVQLMRVEQNGTVTATTFTPTSDRGAKERFQPVDGREVLEKVANLPLSRWNFKAAPGAEHIGPMAQDFREAFGLGENDTTIATVDADGVALAAIQGLNQKVDQQLQSKDARIAELEERLARLEKLISGATNKSLLENQDEN